MPIETPDLEARNEDRLAAEAIARVSGGLTTDVVNAQIATRRELLDLITEGLSVPICPELTNANPGSPHTVILEAMGWLLGKQGYRFNRIPEANLIAFANVVGIERRAATAATTTLRFTVDAPTGGTVVNIPIGTEVSSADSKYVFETTAAGTRTGDGTVDIAAVRTVAGQTLLSPNVLTVLVDTPAYVTAVTNVAAIDAGTELEPVEKTLERMKLFQRRGLRIVTTKDLEDAILNEALNGNGVVRAFPFVKNGEFVSGVKLPGHTTVIVMTKTGDNVDSTTLQSIAKLVDTAVGNQFIYVVNPLFVTFNVEASVKLSTGAPSLATVAAIETRLRNFYAASRENFGRPILRSEVIAEIEATPGVDRVYVPVVPLNEQSTIPPPIIASPLVDVDLKEYELPRVGTVTITVVA